MEKKLSHISPDDYAALLERVSGLELALSALASDNEALAADNAQLAGELERERAERDEAVRAAVEEAVAAVRAELQAVIDSQGAENARLVEQFKLLQQAFFGSRSERVHPDQLSLFNDAETAADGAPEPVADAAEAPKGKRRRGGPRRVDLSRLETVVVEHDLPEGDRACPRCGAEMRELRVEVTEKLRMVPAHLVVEVHRTHVYLCEPCSAADAAGGEVGSPIVRAPRPAEAFPKSLATPSLVAWVVEQKYAMSLPLYRIESQMSALGCVLSRQDMCNWVMLAWERWLVRVRDRIRDYILEAQSKSYCWVFCSCASDEPAYDYVYAPTRGRDVVAGHLSGWSGTLVSDGYAPYFSLGGVTNVACLAHVRRRFALLVKSAGGDAAAAASSGDLRLALDVRRRGEGHGRVRVVVPRHAAPRRARPQAPRGARVLAVPHAPRAQRDLLRSRRAHEQQGGAGGEALRPGPQELALQQHAAGRGGLVRDLFGCHHGQGVRPQPHALRRVAARGAAAGGRPGRPGGRRPLPSVVGRGSRLGPDTRGRGRGAARGPGGAGRRRRSGHAPGGRIGTRPHM